MSVPELIAAGDVESLALRTNIADAVAALIPYFRAWPDLIEGGLFLPLRVLRGLELGKPSTTYTRAATVRLLRKATGTKREIAFGLLTGEGDPSAVLLRRLAEHVRGVPLDVYDLSEAATIEPPNFEVRSAAQKIAAAKRSEVSSRHGTKPKRHKTRAEKAAVALAAKSARQLESDTLSERLGFRERVARGEA